MKNKTAFRRLGVDLHNALQSVPLEADYDAKLALYGKILTEDYNWIKVDKYSTVEELEALETGSRVTTNNNGIAVKHVSGWVLLTEQGYAITHLTSKQLQLPAFSVPSNVNPSPDDVSLDGSTENGKQVT